MVKFRVRNLTEASHGYGGYVVLCGLYAVASACVEGGWKVRQLEVESIL